MKSAAKILGTIGAVSLVLSLIGFFVLPVEAAGLPLMVLLMFYVPFSVVVLVIAALIDGYRRSREHRNGAPD
jgi:membrane-bound ClpP family serine protease